MSRKAPAEDPGDDRLRVGPPKDYAAGIPAVTSSLRHAHAQMGVRRSLLTLLSVNQKTGFDCSGCAWPEPGHRHRAEFCANGAKAVAEEATLRRVTPEFFDEHPLAALAERSDYWLGQQGRLTHPVYRPAGGDRYRQTHRRYVATWSEPCCRNAVRQGTSDGRHGTSPPPSSPGRTKQDASGEGP